MMYPVNRIGNPLSWFRARATDLGLVVAAFLMWSVCSARGQAVTASLQPAWITVGQSAVLTLSFENLNPGGGLRLPEIAGLTLRSGGHSQQTLITNGERTVRHSYQFFVFADAPGEYAIPGFSFQVGNEVVNTDPQKLTVTDGAADPAAPQAAFLRLEAPKSQVYIGEVFPIRITLYYQAARNPQMPTLEAKGFELGQMIDSEPPQETIQGVRYRRYVIERTAKALTTGQLKIGPLECRLEIGTLDPTKRRRTFFGPSEVYVYSPATLTSNELGIEVLPLPTDNVPESFNGAVGTFRMVVDVTPRELAVGDPLTLQVKIGGSGSIGSVALPAQKGWDSFRLYPAKEELNLSDQLGLQGIKEFEQVLIVQSEDVTEFPRFEFSFFDPGLKKYVTLAQESVALEVKGGGDAFPEPAPIVSADAARDQRRDDIVHIKPRMAVVSTAGGAFMLSPVGIGLTSIPLGLWIAAAVRRKRLEFLASNPELAKRRDQQAALGRNVELLEKHAAAGEGDEFMAILFRALQDGIGLRLGVPSSGITEDIVDERLSGEVPPDVCESIHALFTACHEYRYAPERSVEDLEALRARLREVLDRLEES